MAPNRVGSAVDGRKAVGERRKVSSQDFLAPSRAVLEPFRRTCIMRFGARGNDEGLSGRSEGSTGGNPTSCSESSSRSSLTVNAACRGPLLPTTLTRLTRLLLNASSAYSVISVFRSSPRPMTRIRATSRATFPCPITTASSPKSSSRGFKFRYSGRPLYQPTNARAEKIPSNLFSPGIPSSRSLLAP